MLGYVKAYIPELKVREKELYNAYYCGICKSIERRYGQIPRLVLSYDSVFLAMLIEAFREKSEVVNMERCITHYVKKRPMIRDNDGVDFAADMTLLLAYYNFSDDIKDESALKGRIGRSLLKKSFKAIKNTYPEVANNIEKLLKELEELEKNKCDNLDLIGEKFGEVMEVIFLKGTSKDEPSVARPISEISKHLGRWIYLIDAYDDIEKDIENGNYNPLIYRFSYGENTKVKEFKEYIKVDVEFNLYHYLSYLSNAFDLLEIEKNKQILGNIINLGLMKETERVMEGKNERSL
ncbi:MAG TPA: DUF5685 family protein [Anaerovoracaceae bacterium]|nr:DUF5685 family protein [Anaerovoracaceae bacterium]